MARNSKTHRFFAEPLESLPEVVTFLNKHHKYGTGVTATSKDGANVSLTAKGQIEFAQGTRRLTYSLTMAGPFAKLGELPNTRGQAEFDRNATVKNVGQVEFRLDWPEVAYGPRMMRQAEKNGFDKWYGSEVLHFRNGELTVKYSAVITPVKADVIMGTDEKLVSKPLDDKARQYQRTEVVAKELTEPKPTPNGATEPEPTN